MKDKRQKFCGHSCSAIISNTGRPCKHRKQKNYCQICNRRTKLTICSICSGIKNTKTKIPKPKAEITLYDFYNSYKKFNANNELRSQARRAGRKAGFTSCSKCGYSKHIETAHIKPISSYPLDTLISEINDISNLMPLCRNCHWEFDRENKTKKPTKIKINDPVKAYSRLQERLKGKTLQEGIYNKQDRGATYTKIRYWARIVGMVYNLKSCLFCKFDKHIEIAHIKPISSYPSDTLISEINDISNLMSLCRNCHWEFDHGLISLP